MAQQHVRKMTSSEQEAVRKKRQLTEADAPSWDRFPGAADNLPVLAAEYLALNEQVKELELRKKELREAVEEIHLNLEETSIRGDFFLSEVVSTRTGRKLSPTKLLERGVHMNIIEESYEGGEPYTYLRISAREGDL